LTHYLGETLKENRMDITVESILRSKGSDIFSVAPDYTVYDALKLLAEKNIGALLVFDSGKLVGIFSERDYARKVVLNGKFSRTTMVREVMTENVITVDIKENVQVCMDLMTRKRVRHLPVVEEGAFAGVISIGDIVKAIISEQEATIQHLEKYIVGGR
jgi:CBS domain-containing protein